jgi:acyl-CoA reductase-like NAD-dependent aldehyde dehydrogenase
MDALDTLKQRAASWAALPPAERIRLLSACRVRVAQCAEQWASVAARIKGTSGTAASGEEAITGPWGALRALDAYVATLHDVRRYGRRQISRRRIRMRPGDRRAVRVFPNTFVDRLLLPGVTADVWLPSSGVDDMQPRAGGRVVAVMGAGNITSIAVLDVLTKLLNDDAVCILKLHPLLAPLAPIVNDAFAPLVDAGYLATTCGDSDEGASLCRNPLVDEVHVTGSIASYRAIAAETTKPVTAELGNVTPAIVLPGNWSPREIEYVAEAIVSAKLHNNGYNCVALQVLVLPAQWDQRQALLSAIGRIMRSAPPRPAYYPGSVERFHALAGGRVTLPSFGSADVEYLPPSIVEVDASDAGEPLFAHEAFCPLLAVTTIEGDLPSYVRDAVGFCNDRLAGDLAAHIIANDPTLRESSGEVDAAIDRLRYGCVGVNLWCGAGFLMPEVPWGGATGNTPDRIGSGIGKVHNSLRITRSDKTVLRAPLRPLLGRFRPPWFVTQRNAAAIGATLCDYERRRSPMLLARLAWLTLTG